MASSLARNSTDRRPSSIRGSLNTPASNRLYHSTNPSRSHTKIFNRSPRREPKTNRCPLSGSSPTTVFTRSASRSNPHLMSVFSVASQMRTPCAWSRVCKLGSLIMTAAPTLPAPPAGDPHRNRVAPEPRNGSPAESQSPGWGPPWVPLPGVPLPALPQTSAPPLASAVSSRQKNAGHTAHAHGKTRLRSVRSWLVGKPASPTSSTFASYVGSWTQLAIIVGHCARWGWFIAHAECHLQLLQRG